MFSRFEFRGLLSRVDDLDTALPAAERPQPVGTAAAWREGELPEARGRVSLAVADGRFALADEDGVVVGDWERALVSRLRDAVLVTHDSKTLRLPAPPAEDTLIAAYL